MRRRILNLIGAAAMLVTTTLVMPSPASAEPVLQIWKCSQPGANPMTISRNHFWSCPWGTIRVYTSNTWDHLYTIDGYCANTIWNLDRRKTYLNAIWECSY